MATSPSDLHTRQLDQVLKVATEFYSGKELKTFREFVELYYLDIPTEDIRGRDPTELCAIAANHWKLAHNRAGDELNLSVYHSEQQAHGWKAERSYIQMVLPDRPFIVDSVSLVIERLGYRINLTLHPRFSVCRNPNNELSDFSLDAAEGKVGDLENRGSFKHESFVFMEFGPELDIDRLALVEGKIHEAMQDLNFAVNDWQAMRTAMQAVVNTVDTESTPLKKDDIEEAKAFMQWLIDDHFIFLGYREYQLSEHDGLLALKAERETGLGILHQDKSPKTYQTPINSEEAQKQIRQRGLLILTKANAMSNIHRDTHLDYIGVKVYDTNGKIIGEKRFLGLYSSVAYSRSPRYIPLLRLKVERVIEQSELRTESHAGKALMHILENYPRDELMQSNVRELLDTALGLVHLQERKRVRLFVRRDAFRRFFSFQVYVPRDHYNTDVREKIENILKTAVQGVKVESEVHISTSALARVYLVIWTPSNEKVIFPRKNIEQQIREATRPWADAIEVELSKRMELRQAESLVNKYAKAFPQAYSEDVSAYEASHDIERIRTLGKGANDIELSLYRPLDFPASRLRFKIFRHQHSIPISDVLPMLENLGFRAISERPYQLKFADESVIWIQDIELVHKHGEAIDFRPLRDSFQSAFAAIWRGQAENDVLNTLVTDAGLQWREVAVLRAYLRYLYQSNIPYSRVYMSKVLLEHPEFSRQLFRLFAVQFDPALDDKERKRRVHDANKEVKRELKLVTSLDKDRILRAFYNVLKATLRTNYFQTAAQSTAAQGGHKDYISFKFDPAKIPELPLPLPRFEIWVYSPKVEGVHLRGGAVARGGLRWSDRPEDFRTEVLGLMKAQMVKNSVIIPVGAKGCFVVRKPVTGDRDKAFEQGRECYKTFIRGLLDITDNLDGETILPARQVVRLDDDDPYLVVAADKGTATFSDTANGVAAEYDFWMGDAFASGGSVGYDHKKMGITARGAWESVKRHFLELGKDIQKQEFTVAGIGDMAGDVFGNGMLLSPHIRLLAAFNHLHIFLDPDPDAATSYKERERMFNLPRSSWTDYNAELISNGGGVYSRTTKEIPLSPQVQSLLGLEKDKATPTEVIKAILRSEVELLWNGGIGTYTKASTETNTEVGDRANDPVRVNADELRCKVIGEGGNLGFTHRSRIEFALHGGHINTDFIDNAGGVDCSDHEVNIKILLNQVAKQTNLKPAARNKLLESMTDEVADLVLSNNYRQALALSILDSRSVDRTNEYMRVVRNLEDKGLLNREIEFLPDDAQIEERLKSGHGLTRAEIATILSYSKIDLYNALLETDFLDESYCRKKLINYFPTALREKYSDLMPRHRLSREIIANHTSNNIINRMGPAFVQRLHDETGNRLSAVAKAYLVARETFELEETWKKIASLDGEITAHEQYEMYVDASNLLKHATRWMLQEVTVDTDIQKTIDKYADGIKELYTQFPKILDKKQQAAYKQLRDHYVELGVKERAAKRIASNRFMQAALDIVSVAISQDCEVKQVAVSYYKLGQSLHLNWLHQQIVKLKATGRWQAMARSGLRDQGYQLHREITHNVLSLDAECKPGQIQTWVALHAERLEHLEKMIEAIQKSGEIDFSSITVLLQEVGLFMDTA